MMNFDYSSSRETCVRIERSTIEDIDVSEKGDTHLMRYRRLEVRRPSGPGRVMREVRPNKESRKAMKEASDLGEAKISASMILWIAEMT